MVTGPMRMIHSNPKICGLINPIDQPAVKPELTALPVRRPGKFEFVQVHPDPAYRLGPISFIALGRDDYYIVPPNFEELKAREYWIGQIFLATNRLEKPFLWIVKLQTPAGRNQSLVDFRF